MASLMAGITEVQEVQASGSAQQRCALDFLLFRDIVQDHTAELQQACAYWGHTYNGCAYCGCSYRGCAQYGYPYHRPARRSMTPTPTEAMAGTR